MSELITVARPYATAAFNFAVEHQNVDHWQCMLTFASAVSSDQQIATYLSGTLVAAEPLSSLFNLICGNYLDQNGQNLIKILAENRRLSILPIILQQFIQLRNTYEGIIEVNVISTHMLSNRQLKNIYLSMQKNLSCKIKLNCTFDQSIIGGIIIRIDDLVIDGSVRNRLERLKNVLQS
ncbi:F0F1 ATP synthase subunit delta [Candidatus Pantoea carbekii]|nr:F0F1 ATP synthase subunit delta [Candidatus Pantoea carbekii]AKC32300.1 ATP synthase subunit H [Candidatus Pantoea carbekii]